MRRWIIPILVILAIAAAIVWRGALIAWFTDQPMPSAWSSGTNPHPHADLAAGPFSLEIASTPAALQVGDNRVTMSIRDDQAPIDGAQVSLEAVMPAMGAMAEMHATAAMADAGHGAYRGTLSLPMAGTWMLRLGVKTVDGRAGTAALQVATGSALASSASSAPGGVAYYTCSMHTSVKSKTPGQCPICGMDLTPVTTEEVQSGVIFADAQRRQLIGVTTGAAEMKDTELRIRAAGTVTYAEPRLHDIALRYPAWIGELRANAVGMAVKAGDPLFTIYSPDLLTAQQDYLQALAATPADAAIVAATRQRLGLWGLMPAQIAALGAARTAQPYVPILSPADGVVITKAVVAGGAVEAGATALRLADLSDVWVEAALYEYEEATVTVGMPVSIEVTAYPGQRWDGTVDFLYPFLDDATRTKRLRIMLHNHDQRLTPGMYAIAHVRVPLGKRLVVPEDAVIRAGETALVFRDLGDGRLKPQHVTVGLATADGLEILDGLAPGDLVVTRALFLLAAESRLKSGAARW